MIDVLPTDPNTSKISFCANQRLGMGFGPPCVHLAFHVGKPILKYHHHLSGIMDLGVLDLVAAIGNASTLNPDRWISGML